MILHVAHHITHSEEGITKLAEVFLTLVRVNECQSRFVVKPSTLREEAVGHLVLATSTARAQLLYFLLTRTLRD